MSAPRCKLDTSPAGKTWVWYRRLDRRNGYLAWGSVGTPFDRSRPLHWLVAAYVLLRDGKRKGWCER